MNFFFVLLRIYFEWCDSDIISTKLFKSAIKISIFLQKLFTQLQIAIFAIKSEKKNHPLQPIFHEKFNVVASLIARYTSIPAAIKKSS